MVIFSSAEDRNALEGERVTKWKTLELGKSCGVVPGEVQDISHKQQSLPTVCRGGLGSFANML